MPTPVTERNGVTNLVFLAVHFVNSVQVSRVDRSPRRAFVLEKAYFLAYRINACPIDQF